jgi:ParB family chromosome partitioning protein
MSNKTKKTKRDSSTRAHKKDAARKPTGGAVPKEAAAGSEAGPAPADGFAPNGMRPAEDAFIIPLSAIKIGPNNRKMMKNIPSLASSIKRRGLKQPLLVRDLGDGTFLLVAGERRYHAVTSLGWAEVKVTLQAKSTDEASDALDNIIENLQREDPEPLEQAEAFQRLLDEYGMTQKGISHETGISEPVISQRLAMLGKAVPELREEVKAKRTSPTVAREVMRLPDNEQREVLQEIKDKQQSGRKVTVRDIQDEVDRRRAKQKPKNPADEEMLERVRKVREHYQDSDLSVRPKREVIDQLGQLQGRVEKTSSTQKKVTLKSQIATLEWVLTIRESF